MELFEQKCIGVWLSIDCVESFQYKINFCFQGNFFPKEDKIFFMSLHLGNFNSIQGDLYVECPQLPSRQMGTYFICSYEKGEVPNLLCLFKSSPSHFLPSFLEGGRGVIEVVSLGMVTLQAAIQRTQQRVECFSQWRDGISFQGCFFSRWRRNS